MEKKKIKAFLEVLGNFFANYPQKTRYISENTTEVCERQKLTIEDVF